MDRLSVINHIKSYFDSPACLDLTGAQVWVDEFENLWIIRPDGSAVELCATEWDRLPSGLAKEIAEAGIDRGEYE